MRNHYVHRLLNEQRKIKEQYTREKKNRDETKHDENEKNSICNSLVSVQQRHDAV